MYASMSGSPVPTHVNFNTNDTPRTHEAQLVPTSPAGWYWPSPQMPLQRAESPEAKQDNCIKWDHTREAHADDSNNVRHARHRTKAQQHAHTPPWERQHPTGRAGPSQLPSPSLSPPRRAEPKRRKATPSLKSDHMPYCRCANIGASGQRIGPMLGRWRGRRLKSEQTTIWLELGSHAIVQMCKQVESPSLNKTPL